MLRFAEHLGGQTTSGKTFVMEDLLPVHDNAGEEIPSYQIYLALAWLRHTGAVEKKGRDGYVLRNSELSDGGFEEYWATLPMRKV